MVPLWPVRQLKAFKGQVPIRANLLFPSAAKITTFGELSPINAVSIGH